MLHGLIIRIAIRDKEKKSPVAWSEFLCTENAGGRKLLLLNGSSCWDAFSGDVQVRYVVRNVKYRRSDVRKEASSVHQDQHFQQSNPLVSARGGDAAAFDEDATPLPPSTPIDRTFAGGAADEKIFHEHLQDSDIGVYYNPHKYRRMALFDFMVGRLSLPYEPDHTQLYWPNGHSAEYQALNDALAALEDLPNDGHRDVGAAKRALRAYSNAISPQFPDRIDVQSSRRVDDFLRQLSSSTTATSRVHDVVCTFPGIDETEVPVKWRGYAF